MSAANQRHRRGDDDRSKKRSFRHEAVPCFVLEIPRADFAERDMIGAFAGAMADKIESCRVIIAINWGGTKMRACRPNLVRVAFAVFGFRKYRFHNFLLAYL